MNNTGISNMSIQENGPANQGRAQSELQMYNTSKVKVNNFTSFEGGNDNMKTQTSTNNFNMDQSEYQLKAKKTGKDW